MARASFAWDLARNLTVKMLFILYKIHPETPLFGENSLYKNPLFLREPARGPECSRNMI